MKITKISVSLGKKEQLGRYLGSSRRYDSINPFVSLEADLEENELPEVALAELEHIATREVDSFIDNLIANEKAKLDEEIEDGEDV